MWTLYGRVRVRMYEIEVTLTKTVNLSADRVKDLIGDDPSSASSIIGAAKSHGRLVTHDEVVTAVNIHDSPSDTHDSGLGNNDVVLPNGEVTSIDEVKRWVEVPEPGKSVEISWKVMDRTTDGVLLEGNATDEPAEIPWEKFRVDVLLGRMQPLRSYAEG